MTDEELIERLRDAAGIDQQEYPYPLCSAAADLITALTEQLAAAKRDAKEAEAYAAELESSAKWQPIETAPKDGTPVLLWESDVDGICLGCHENGSWWNNLYEPWRFNPTHWMPLPEAPAP